MNCITRFSREERDRRLRPIRPAGGSVIAIGSTTPGGTPGFPIRRAEANFYQLHQDSPILSQDPLTPPPDLAGQLAFRSLASSLLWSLITLHVSLQTGLVSESMPLARAVREAQSHRNAVQTCADRLARDGSLTSRGSVRRRLLTLHTFHHLARVSPTRVCSSYRPHTHHASVKFCRLGDCRLSIYGTLTPRGRLFAFGGAQRPTSVIHPERRGFVGAK